MKFTWAYVAGFFDGEGTQGMLPYLNVKKTFIEDYLRFVKFYPPRMGPRSRRGRISENELQQMHKMRLGGAFWRQIGEKFLVSGPTAYAHVTAFRSRAISQ